MHVGFNLVFLTPGQQGGMEIYVRELLPQLVAANSGHRFTAFVNHDASVSPGPWNGLMDTVTVPVHATNRMEWVRGEQQLLVPLAQRTGVELLHSLANTAPAWGRFRRVVTVHDLNYRTVPELRGIHSLGMRALVPLAARRSHRVIVDSQATRQDVRRFLHTPEDKIDVVPLGLGVVRRTAPLTEAEVRSWLDAGTRPLLLSVSAKLAHKNLMRLLGAMAAIEPAARPLLTLPGYPTPHEEALRRRAAELKLGDDVRFVGWVSPEQLEGLYAAARCVILPSLAEGFGLPVLEAMARGVPVACSARGALAEVADDAALLFDPESEAAIAGAIMTLMNDPALCARLATAGPARAARFSWEATAAGTLASYERAVANAGPAA